jgi:hypothetical protein
VEAAELPLAGVALAGGGDAGRLPIDWTPLPGVVGASSAVPPPAEQPVASTPSAKAVPANFAQKNGIKAERCMSILNLASCQKNEAARTRTSTHGIPPAAAQR